MRKREREKIMFKFLDSLTLRIFICAMASWIELAYNERYYANLWVDMHAATRKNKMYKKESENLINYLLHDG